jgi:DNA repair exonuclease SbcCD ATPase subunit
MKVEFNRIEINYYKSIIKAELSYLNGVWLIQGQNNDAFGSNGAGKSTLLEALQQCLYNRTTKGTTLDTTINRKTGKQYRITVDLTVDDVQYRITNDRTSLKITIYKLTNGSYEDLMIKSIPASLTYIQNLVGLDFQSFVALTHITHSTVTDMTDNLSNSNLIKVLLDFGVLNRFEKKVKEYYKDSQSSVDKMLSRKHEIETNLKLLTVFKPTNTINMYTRLATIITEVQEIKLNIERITDYYSQQEQAVNIQLQDVDKDIWNNKKIVEHSVCPTCGCNVVEYKKLDVDTINNLIKTLENKKEQLTAKLNEYHTDKVAKLQPYYSELSQLEGEISALTNQIHIAEYNESMYKANKPMIKTLQVELNNITKALPTEYQNQEVLTHTIDILKKGTVQHDIIKEFTDIVNIHIKEYLQYVSIDYISVLTVPNKTGFTYKVYDHRYESEINFNELSGGELTRTRLVILLSVLKTVQIMTNTSVNILVFDEALDTLDKAAASDLARLFNNLVENNNQFIAMVSHGEQLSEIKFRGNVLVTKTDNVTRVAQGAY